MLVLKKLCTSVLFTIILFGILTGAKTIAPETEANPEKVPADIGALTGVITFEGVAPKKKALKITKDVHVCGKGQLYDERLVLGENKGMQNVIISIKGVTGGDLKALGSNFEIHQTGCTFVPHMTLLPVNAPVTIFNDDGILHNLHTVSKKNRPFNIAQPKFRKKIEKTFKQPEVVKIKCDVHGWMKGYIIVVDHPYYTLSAAGGKYTISGIPAGTYQVEYLHEALGKITKEVTISTGGETRLDVSFSPKPKKKTK